MANQKSRAHRSGDTGAKDLNRPRPPEQVIPEPLARAVAELDYWFVIGGHAVRCFCPYRPTRDVDFGVKLPTDLEELLAELSRRGRVEIVERGEQTVHLRYDGTNVSIFVLAELASFTEQRRLSVTGIIATKLHAILDRGARRDFFDLYVTMHLDQLGMVACIGAMREVYGPELNEPLLLRALTHFDEAEREAMLPGEGADDWSTVKDFFLTRVGQLLVPPTKTLAIQGREVDVRGKRPRAI
ncbi:MAG: nucleotidyl transferase AbiEii/AbiGii toxin family protein [Deltaproteobacteria bacterium]|nr:nucleotidyl transferase AbiEii/AbiGii toxin family protein [Deltaproteobacteria bacterium]